MARIRRYDDETFGGEKNAVSYVLKNLGANAYELSKFEQEGTDSRFSPALLEFLQERSNRITVKADLEKVQVAPTGPRP